MFQLSQQSQSSQRSPYFALRATKGRQKSQALPAMSLIEIIIALAVFALIVSALTAMVTGGFSSLNQGKEQTEAASLANEGIEAVRVIRNQGFNNLTYSSTTGLLASSTWSFLGDGTSDSIGKYTRKISFETLCRDGNYNLATCPASSTDIYSKKVTVTVSWVTSYGKTNSVLRSAYLSDWQGKYFTQSDWYGGSGQATWSFINKYDSDDGNLGTSTPGQITLFGSGTAYASSTWLISSAFNMATSGAAQAIEWDQNIASCTPACNIQLQVRTAPDSAGAPGAWTSWYGASGANTYFTNNTGSLLPTALLGVNNSNQWVAYKALLSSNGTNTPILQEVRIDYR